MKPVHEWARELTTLTADPDVKLVSGRGGEATLKVGSTYLHSLYRPREEAQRLIDSAELDLTRPVLVIGVGLGYHVLELLNRGANVAVIEPDMGVAKLAIDGLLKDADILLGIGDLDAIADSPAFREFAQSIPQTLVHPPTAKLHPEYCEQALAMTTKAALGAQRLRIAVVGPMYGGSLPIAGYLERAFRSLGHTTLLVDNSLAWELYQATMQVKTKHAANQLGEMLSNFLGEWSYARTAEFAPDICIVLAQAPVGKRFPVRLAQEGVATAFWYVENWRHLPYWRDIAPLYDCFFHIQPGEFERMLTEAGSLCHAFVQTACDPETHKPVTLTEDEADEFGCDISFAGAGYYNRLQTFKGLTDYNFKIWGVDWHANELQPLLCRAGARFTPELFAKVVAGSKININLHSSTIHDGVDPQCDAINPRVFEIAACGGFQLCDPCVGLDTLFDFETELPVYRNLPELREKIDYFLSHPDERAQFVERARERVLREHTYKHRAQAMLDVILEHQGAKILRKGIRIQRTVTEMAERVKDEQLAQYLASLPEDTLFTHESVSATFGPGRENMPYSEGVFRYLSEVRSFAETLLASHR